MDIHLSAKPVKQLEPIRPWFLLWLVSTLRRISNKTFCLLWFHGHYSIYDTIACVRGSMCVSQADVAAPILSRISFANYYFVANSFVTPTFSPCGSIRSLNVPLFYCWNGGAHIMCPARVLNSKSALFMKPTTINECNAVCNILFDDKIKPPKYWAS